MTNEQTIILIKEIKSSIENAVNDFKNENPELSKERLNLLKQKYNYYPSMHYFEEIIERLDSHLGVLLYPNLTTI